MKQNIYQDIEAVRGCPKDNECVGGGVLLAGLMPTCCS